jgi:predicted ATPase/DNA-binding SARP family transcriptional activator
MPHLELSFLGPLQVKLDGQLVTGFEADKVRALLVYLAVETSRPHRREQLATLFWPGWPDASARTSLRNALSNLRKTIWDEAADPHFLLITRETIQFNLESSYTLDTLELERSANNPNPSIDQFQTALNRYRGSFLEGFTLKDCPEFDDWSQIEREQLQVTASSAFSRLAGTYEKEKDFEKAVSCVHRRLSLEPWQEDAHRQLMRLLAASGQRSAALAQFEACKRALQDELGVEPSAETVRLYESIRESASAEPYQVKAPHHNLPAQLTSFIGRQKEITRVKSLLNAHRLVTLTGSGGTGKSRLSLQIASELLEKFPDGVWLVELAPLTEPERVPSAVARGLGLRETTDPEAVSLLEDFLKSKHLLLILDNCEHLIEDCARLANALLHACPHLSILASSREALGIEGEASFRVPPLSFPPAGKAPDSLTQYEAIRLFVERAETASPEFTLSMQHAPAVAQICQRLDGIPLALELAAARLKLLSVEEIADRLDDTFRLLTGGSRAALPRYQTLRASIDWSYALLSPAEKALLQRLSVFAGGWFLEAAEVVSCGESIQPCDLLDLLGQLVNKSLVSVEAEAGHDTRYRMLETIRQYAQEKLAEAGEAELVRHRHLQYYVDLAERVENKLRGPDQAAITERLIADLDNLRLALRWSLEGKGKPGWTPEPGLRLASALMYFWNSRLLHAEALEWLEPLLLADMEERQEKPASLGRTLIRANALKVAGEMVLNIGELEQGTIFLEESRTLFKESGTDGKKGLAYSLRNLHGMARSKGDVIQAKALLEESLALSTEEGDLFNIGECLRFLGSIAIEQGDLVQASRLYQENLALRKEIGDLDGEALAYMWMGWFYMDLFDIEKTRSLFKKGLQIGSLIKNTFLVSIALSGLGGIDWLQGKYEPAEKKYIEAQSIGSYTSNLANTQNLFSVIGDLALSQGDFEKAADNFKDYLMINQKKNLKGFTALGLKNFGDLALAKGDIEQAIGRYNEALTRSQEFGYPYGEAIVLSGLGRAACQKSDLESALRYSLESIGKSHNNFSFDPWGNPFPISIETLAFLAIQQGQMERAARLLGASQDWHVKVQYTRTPQMRQEREKAFAAVREVLGDEAFTASLEEGKAMSIEQVIEYARR